MTLAGLVSQADRSGNAEILCHFLGAGSLNAKILCHFLINERDGYRHSPARSSVSLASPPLLSHFVGLHANARGGVAAASQRCAVLRTTGSFTLYSASMPAGRPGRRVCH